LVRMMDVYNIACDPILRSPWQIPSWSRIGPREQDF
jgi:hypothetical protein